MSEQEQARAPDPLGDILVVDDNEDNCTVLSRRLVRQGYAVDIAKDGPSALGACEKKEYDAVILDVMMPGMSGIEVLERLRQTKSATELLVIMATAKTDSVDVIDALKRGANDYVTKPIDFPVLLARLQTQLTIKKEADQRSGSVIDVTLGIEPGTIIDGRYEILDQQGEGGFAVVYRATQLSTGQEVALKHARPDVMRGDQDGVHLERFKREVAMIGQLNHPNVVRLIDSGAIAVRRPVKAMSSTEPPTRAEGGRQASEDANSRMRRRPSSEPDDRAVEVPYIVMEYLRGESLAGLIGREAPLAIGRAVDLILPVVSALGAAHAQGVVHRDIKPSNIMLAEGTEGAIEPKVLDFGIAKLSEPDMRALTISASLIGTPQYMPPEQARGQKDVDGRADLFAVASVLYEMLTGHCLYHGQSFLELVAKVLSAEHRSIRELRPELPEDLANVIEKALAGDRDERYGSMKAFGQALLPHASPSAALRWAEAFGQSSSVPVPMVTSLAHPPKFRISTTDEVSNPTDATVVVEVKVVTPEAFTPSTTASPAPTPSTSEPTTATAPAPPEKPQRTALPWPLIAVAFAAGIAFAKLFL